MCAVPYHSIACSKPSPFIADVLNIAHVLFLRADRPKAVDTSDGLIAPSISYVIMKKDLLKTTTVTKMVVTIHKIVHCSAEAGETGNHVCRYIAM